MIPAGLARALADRYHLERELGRGGMATVYLADDLKHGRKVAIKFMHPELAAEIGPDRFLREIEAAARLSHPHILPLFDSGGADGQFFYVMPYVAGESLRGRLNREIQLPLDEAMRLTREIASALGTAHQHGLVHRDIKPDNILLADGFALVADFGTARLLSGYASDTTATRAATAPGTAIGTPLYMAPEQAVGSDDVDGRADLYALGCVLYEMLAGQPPFTAPNVQAVIARHRNDPVPPLASQRPGIPDSVVRVIEKALAKAPADRYPTMARFAEALAVAEAERATPIPAPQLEEGKIPNNLARPRTRFIGRERELAECAQLLQETRLLTLTGAGGCGKTRLALRLAERVLEDYPDGVWFADLAPLLEGDRVPLVVAKAIGLQETPGTPLPEALAQHLATRRSLLVLDNCEHIISAVTELADRLLGASEALQLIATSREGLGIEGERLFALRSLSLPARDAEGGVLQAESSESVQLFVDRARVVDPRYALDAHTALVVAEICRRLDGIPLALELAAARVKMMSVEDIRARLDDRFRLLTGGTRTAMPRQRTLLATIEWSYEHLADDERRLLRFLSVFAGGWSLPAATVVSGENADEFETLETLGRLVSKSLVNVERLSDGGTRYSMLETIQQYARDQLRASAEVDAARSRHLEYVLVLASELPAGTRGPRRTEWESRVLREQENILAAIQWCDQAERGGEKALRIVGAILSPWMDQGQFELCNRVAVEALRRPGAEQRTALRAHVLYPLGVLCYWQARFQDARGALDEALEIFRETGDRAGLIRALIFSGHATALDDRERARPITLEALAICRELGDPFLLGRALNALAESERFDGALDKATALYEEAIEIARHQSDERSVLSYLWNLSAVDVGMGRLDRARERLLETGDLMRHFQPGSFFALSQIDPISALACASGDMAIAARLAGAAAGMAEAMRFTREPVDEKFIGPSVDRMREALGGDAFEVAFAAGRQLEWRAALQEARAWLARESGP
jgi:predicted ATPase/tRNA A-37 threonylcarbamoyl transferase component Bud32